MRKYEKMIGRRTLGRMTMKLTHRVKGHSLLHSLAPLIHSRHRSLIRLLYTSALPASLARSAALIHPLTCSFSHSGAHGKVVFV